MIEYSKRVAEEASIFRMAESVSVSSGKYSCAIVYTAGRIECKVSAICLKKQVFRDEIKEISENCEAYYTLYLSKTMLRFNQTAGCETDYIALRYTEYTKGICFCW